MDKNETYGSLGDLARNLFDRGANADEAFMAFVDYEL